MQQNITHAPSGTRGAQHVIPPEPLADSAEPSMDSTRVEPKLILDAYTNGALNDEQLIAQLSARCRSDEDATWDALSLLDQYHRRGLLETSLFLTAKTELNAAVFGVRRTQNNAHTGTTRIPSADESQKHPTPPSSPTSEQSRAAANTATLNAHSDTRRADTAPATPNATRGGFRPGALLRHRYVLIAPQTSTKSANIYKAFDRHRAGLPEHDAYVSLKCLRDECTGSALAQGALEAEFAAASRLSHPNILHVYDFHADGQQSFLTMEPLQGQLLAHVIERFAPKSLHPSHARRIVHDIGLALHHAHRQHIFHSNLTASTVLIQPSGEVRVFGFAAMLTLDQLNQSEIRERSFKADLFALASVAYHVLSGREPFDTTNGKLERRWQRVGVPKQHWRAIEQVLSGGETRQWRSILDWLTSFDGGAADKITPLTELQPAEQTASPKRTPIAFGVAAMLLITAAAWLWLPIQPEIQTYADQQDARSIDDARTDIIATETAAAMPTSLADAQDLDLPTNAPEPVASSEALTPPAPSVMRAVQTKSISTDASTDSKSDSTADTKLTTASTTTLVAKMADAKAIPAKPIVSFAESPVIVNQGEPVAKLTLRRTGSTREPLSLRWRTAEGSAKAHTAFIPADDGAVEFAPGQRTAEIFIPLVNGKPTRYSQWFSVELLPADTTDLGAIPSATVFISKAEALADSAP